MVTKVRGEQPGQVARAGGDAHLVAQRPDEEVAREQREVDSERPQERRISPGSTGTTAATGAPALPYHYARQGTVLADTLLSQWSSVKVSRRTALIVEGALLEAARPGGERPRSGWRAPT
jgi:hypothetical protein